MPLDARCTTNSCRFKCSNNFTEEMRAAICDEYYKLADSSLKKDTILSLITEETVKRNRSRNNIDRKKKLKSCTYHLSINNIKERVCKEFFCKFFRCGGCFEAKGGGWLAYSGTDKRAGKTPVNKTSEERLGNVRKHIDLFPRIEPHYCRKDSTKQYLSPDLNIKQMYRLYKQYCTENGIIDPVKEGIYRRVFVTEYNFGFYVPKTNVPCAMRTTLLRRTTKRNFVRIGRKIKTGGELYEGESNRKNQGDRNWSIPRRMIWSGSGAYNTICWGCANNLQKEIVCF